MSTYTITSYPAIYVPLEYKNLIFSKWMRSLRYGNDYYKLIEPGAFFKTYQQLINNILARRDAFVIVAALTDDPDVVLGFSVSHGPVLDYVHVHKDHRRHGIGRRLVPEAVTTISHLTRLGASIWGSHYGHLIFNPFA